MTNTAMKSLGENASQRVSQNAALGFINHHKYQAPVAFTAGTKAT